jgi:glycosyltransferase involved in cell wall biosynthesis
MKVLAMFDYSQAERAWELWKNGQERESPEQNLWGVTQLHKHGIDVDLLPYKKYPFLPRDIEQQLRVILNSSKYDMIYSTCQTSTTVLALLRILGVFRKPVIVKLERPFKSGLLSKMLMQLFARGHDKLLCLSSRVENQLRDEFGISEQKVALLDWGPDLPSYEVEKNTFETRDARFFMSAGNSNRDYNSLVSTFDGIDYPLRIYCSEASAPALATLPQNVKIHYNHPTATTALSWKELVAEYDKAYAIAIPLYIPPNRTDNSPLWGLTSLLDAMAMGKATIMTKHRQVNIDLEKEGIGLWVEQGDVEGWQKAVSYLLEHPQETQEMGKRARRLAEEKYNLDIFSRQLAGALQSVLVATNLKRDTVGTKI